MRSAFLAFVLSLAFAACATSRTFDSTFDETLELSPSTAEGKARPGVAVAVTRAAILVEGEAVVTIAAGKVDPRLKRDGQPYAIAPLIEALEKRAGPDHLAALRARKPVDARVILSVDRTLSYRLFLEVVYSCGQAGYAKYDLIVKKTTDGSLAAVSFAVPVIASGQIPTTPEVVVTVTPNAFEVFIDGERSELRRLANGRYDHERLRTMLSDLRASAGEAKSIEVSLAATPSVPFEVVIATMDTMRVTNDRTPLFPDIEFAATIK